MEIALIYHSQTGNTERFANALADALMLAGHTVNSIKLQTVNPVKQAHVKSHQDIAFTNLPDPAAFDLILFGGPVWAFGPSPVIIAAISEMGTLSGKKAIPCPVGPAAPAPPQASTPPARLITGENPCPARIAAAAALRWPERH